MTPRCNKVHIVIGSLAKLAKHERDDVSMQSRHINGSAHFGEALREYRVVGPCSLGDVHNGVVVVWIH